MNVFPIQFMPNGDRCLWDERGNARVMRGDYAANDNSEAWAEIYKHRRETEALIQAFTNADYIIDQLCTVGRV